MIKCERTIKIEGNNFIMYESGTGIRRKEGFEGEYLQRN